MKQFWRKIVLTGALLAGCVLLVDIIGIHLLRDNGLGFQVQVYSWWLTLLPAVAAFAWILRREDLPPGTLILAAAACGALWWFVTSVALFYLHGVFGGWY